MELWDVSIAVQKIQISRLELLRWSLELFLTFLKYIFGSWKWDLANSYRDHVIQISKKKCSICRNIHSLWSNTYFRGTFMYVQYGFLYLILTRPKLTVCTDTCATEQKGENSFPSSFRVESTLNSHCPKKQIGVISSLFHSNLRSIFDVR
jgi:hypothetical protein